MLNIYIYVIILSVSEEFTEFDICDSIEGESNANDLEDANKYVTNVRV